MSYSVQDRYGGLCTTYNNSLGPSGTGRTWWPDYGPTTQAFSFQEKQHPTETIFEKVVKPFTRQGASASAPELSPLRPQFRHPQPAREAIHQGEPDGAAKLAAHAVTSRQASLRRMEVRQRRIDKWIGDPPNRVGARDALSVSEGRPSAMFGSSLSNSQLSSAQASQVSREVYERHGFLVGRSKGSIADGGRGARPRKANTLSFHAMLMAGGSGNSRPSRPSSKKPSGQWRICPESSFVFDPRSFLPVPRGGWDAQLPLEWPEAKGNTQREFAAPVNFADASGSFGASGGFGGGGGDRSASATPSGSAAGE
eukprot:TRINITY_DN10530_c0_g1_i2.p1 TRINITY_DN10530_c0_g1~~TRINITY_DN10530_c0_g1_i2.p1  ORF type:complete len:311 (-),score=55.36 TRINITY_DN10530_c0_g1_i2:283-1215(-)